ncbi:MAG: DUF952 domain-containing protein [Bauldia sp.]|nr:DUF952 domain-containing protein [Bauldia sp.]
MPIVYKICPEALWRRAEADGVFHGSPDDLRDGFIHFSAPDQVADTARKHFAGQNNLVLAAFEASALGAALRYEPARDGGTLFPHLYAPLDPRRALWVKPLPLGPSGHVFPPGAP